MRKTVDGIRIGKEGWLEIQRSGAFKNQHCPFCVFNDISRNSARCGDWCPHFGGPIIPDEGLHHGDAFLSLCQDVVLVTVSDRFEDLRE